MAVRFFPLPSHDPTGGRVIVTSPFGPRWGRLHAGVDLGTSDGIERGVPVIAPEDADLSASGFNGAVPSEGRWLWLEGETGLWKFFHLDGFAPGPRPRRVKAGEVIAYVGSTGTSAAHLHLELWRNGQPVDPWPYIKDAPFVGEVAPEPETEDVFDMAIDEAKLRKIIREEVDAALFGTAINTEVIKGQLCPNGTDPTHRSLVERIVNKVEA